jgi:predicted short-subunit dehydrogenase-like oxidoreductase (DUF2520 family)
MHITIIGSGNVATHLAVHLKKNDHVIDTVYSRNIVNAQVLSKKVDAVPVDNIKTISSGSDIYIISVSDKAVINIIEQINFNPKLIVHTTGSLSIDILSKFSNYGVLYPLQTFTKNRNIDIVKVPFCIEANNTGSLNQIKLLAGSLSHTVYQLNSEQRLQCHIAAVFANNFANHMFAVAEKILQEKNIPFDIVKPLIQETAGKVMQIPPDEAQTGPAVRKDTITINKHLEIIKNREFKKIYSFVSDSIRMFKKK